MKAKNRTWGSLIMALLCTLTFSCKKEAGSHAATNDLAAAARNLEGTQLTGSITVVKEEGESALLFNNANKLVVVGLPECNSLPAGTIEPAELIVSKYGVVAKDVVKNKVWLLANRDEPSKRKFESIRAPFPNANYLATVFNIIEINTGKE